MESYDISIKRLFLNIGLLLMFVGLVCAGLIFRENFKLTAVEGTVVGYETEVFHYRTNKGEYDEEQHIPVIEYTYGGETHRDNAWKAKGMTHEETLALHNGDKAIFYTRSGAYLISPDPYWAVLFFAVPGAFLILVCCKAFKGYKRDFLMRYKKAVTATVVLQTVTVVLSVLWIIHIENTEYGGFMPGLDALADELAMWFAWVLVAISIMVIWIVASVKFMRMRKKALQQG